MLSKYIMRTWRDLLVAFIVWFTSEGLSSGEGKSEKDRKLCFQGSEQHLNSFLWKIERKPPAYLFGTIHVRFDAVWSYIPQNTKYALRTSRSLQTELNFSNRSVVEAIKKCRLLPGSLTLRDVLPRRLYLRLKRHLDYVRGTIENWLPKEWRNPLMAANYFKLLTKNWERKKPIWIVVLIMNDLTPTGVNSNQRLALDLYLGDRARRKRQEVGGLESAADQCDPFNNLNHTQALFLLNHTLYLQELINAEKIQPQFQQQQKTLVEHYQCGDLPSVLKNTGKLLPSVNVTQLITDEQQKQVMEIDRYFIEELLYKRNRKMAKSIDSLLKTRNDTSFFIAIGVGHLFGNYSLVDLLQSEGYTVRHIKPTERFPGQKKKRRERRRNGKKRRNRKKAMKKEERELLNKIKEHEKKFEIIWKRINKTARNHVEQTPFPYHRWNSQTAAPQPPQVRIIEKVEKKTTYVYYYTPNSSQRIYPPTFTMVVLWCLVYIMRQMVT